MYRMTWNIYVYVLLLFLIPQQAYLGILENMTDILKVANDDRCVQSQGNLKALGDLGMEVGKSLDTHGKYLAQKLNDLGKVLENGTNENTEVLKNLEKELNDTKQDLIRFSHNFENKMDDLREELGKELQVISKEIRESKHDRETQHNEMMHIFRQVLGSIEVTVKGKNVSLAGDCAVLYKSGKKSSGIYGIKPAGLKAGFDVYCDMEKDRGGWTVIQRRGDFGRTYENYFYKTWNEYKTGFGQLDGEHWLGNERISALTKQGTYELHIEMVDYLNKRFYANYKKFWLEGEGGKYKLHIGGFSGNTDDAMKNHNGNQFSTHDRDNDLADGNCAVHHSGAWWYTNCYTSNLNGKRAKDNGGLKWWVDSGRYYVDPSYVQMKIKPVSF